MSSNPQVGPALNSMLVALPPHILPSPASQTSLVLDLLQPLVPFLTDVVGCSRGIQLDLFGVVGVVFVVYPYYSYDKSLHSRRNPESPSIMALPVMSSGRKIFHCAVDETALTTNISEIKKWTTNGSINLIVPLYSKCGHW